MTTISIRIAELRTLRTARSQAASKSFAGRVLSWLRSVWCVINGGHYKVLHTEPERLALRCVACGHMSPGWEVGSSARFRHRAPAEPDRARVRRPVAA